MSCGSGQVPKIRTQRTLTQNLLLILFKTVGDIGCEFVYRGFRRFGNALVSVENFASKRVEKKQPPWKLTLLVLLAGAVWQVLR